MAIEFEVRETFRDSPSAIFAAMTDLSAAGAWKQNLVSLEPLTEGSFRAGTEYRETRRLLGQDVTEHFEVLTCEPPGRLSIRADGRKGSSGSGEFLFDFTLVPAGTGTRVTMRARISNVGGILGMLGGFMKGPYRKACADDLTALKHHIEG